ncbi:MAG: aminotransferase class V-fold PLP-dependent enzyme, partial [Candidatus Thermoplasmatota archaeon]|nr:aminotransferase class V-fold PLP-dependent enzyme [Candidatus Thermoplasmatota archaeon]
TYLDNACVTLKPESVIKSISDYYNMYPGCGGRSVHRYGTQVSRLVSQSRKSIAKFINANSVNEVVFTRNTTHSINQIAKGLSWNKGDVIITGDREHNSNLVPWLQLAEEQGIEHRIVESNPDNTFNLENFEQLCEEVGDRLKMVSLSQVGNLDGISIPIKKIAKITHQYDALIAVDGAQSTPHMRVDVQDLDIDFISFSIHKMCGPSGMGGLWGRYELLDSLSSIQSGGQTVETSHYDSIKWAAPPSKFEGGLGNFAGMIASGKAIDYLSKLDMNAVHEHEIKLNKIITNKIKHLDAIEIIGPEDASHRGGICSILMGDLPSHDIAILLDEAAGVMVRSGQHC